MSTLPIVHRYAARFAAMILAGVAVGVICGVASGWPFGLVLGWATASFVYVTWVWLAVGRMDAEDTKSHAVREDPVRGVAEALILLASVGSLGAVGLLLVEARSASDARAGAIAAMALASVALSWLLIHTIYTLRYASSYYGGKPGGINFNTKQPPRYVDFAYVAFSVGMTFQISDTNLESTGLRGTVLRHALLSYVFGTVILATTINLAVSLSS